MPRPHCSGLPPRRSTSLAFEGELAAGAAPLRGDYDSTVIVPPTAALDHTVLSNGFVRPPPSGPRRILHVED